MKGQEGIGPLPVVRVILLAKEDPIPSSSGTEPTLVLSRDPSQVVEALAEGHELAAVWPPGPVELVAGLVDRIRTHRRLLRRAQVFERLVENIDEGMWMKWERPSSFFANGRLDDLFGLPRQGAKGLGDLSNLIHPSDRSKWVELMAKLEGSDSSWTWTDPSGKWVRHQMEIRVHHPSEDERWIRHSVFPIAIEEEIVCFCGYLEDITEERAIATRLLRYRKVYENTQDGILIADMSGQIMDINPALQIYSGLGPDDIGTEAPILRMRSEEQRSVRAAMEARTPHRQVVEMDTDEGAKVAVDLAVFPIYDDAGVPIGFGFVGRDISELRDAYRQLQHTADELRQTQAQLVQTEKMASLGAMVAGIAHEMNTPLGAVTSMHDTLVRALARLDSLPPDTSPQRREKVLKLVEDANLTIRSGLERVSFIVKRLRSFARLDEAELKDADVNECLEDALLLIEHDLAPGVVIERRFADLPKIPCYPGRLNQVFLNLITNAQQATRAPGVITLETGMGPDDEVYVAVTDDGHGIDERDLDQIFDPGYTTRGSGVGLGLGLAICFQVVSEHRGHLDVRSRPATGSTFTVRLPRRLRREGDDREPSRPSFAVRPETAQ